MISWFVSMDEGESTDFLVPYHGSRRIFLFPCSLPWIHENLLILLFLIMDKGESTDFVVPYHGSKRIY